MASSPEEIKKHTKTYLLVGATLFVFTVITVLVSYWEHENHAINMGIGMAIAAFKASLVAIIFMHLSTDWHNRMIKMFLIFAAVFFVALMMLTIWGKFNPIKTIFG